EDPRDRLGAARVLFDESGSRGVQTATGCAWQGPVGDVADERVLEPELDVAFEPTRRLTPDEVPALQILEDRVQIGDAADGSDDLLPERPPDDGRGKERGPSIGRKRIETRGDHGADGDRKLVDPALLGGCRRQLLDEEWIPFGDVDETPNRVAVRGGQQARGHLGRDVGRERIERDPRLGGAPDAPRRPCVDELGPRERDEEHARIANVGAEILEEIELARRSPVDVLDDYERRVLLTHPLDESPGGE